MLIDLGPMNGVQVDPERKIAKVGGGALWSDVDQATQAHGLATPGGVVSDTGVAGLTLGGGYGWLRRKHGLSSDNVIEAEVVTADGQVLTASADENPDLYWAIRGGGGNFGIVTSFTFALHPVGPEVAFSATFYPIEEYAQVLRGWRDYVEQAPDEVTTVCVGITFPANPELPEAIHDRPVVIVGGVFVGDVDEGLKITAPLRELGTPLFDMSGPTPFVGVQTGLRPAVPARRAPGVLEVPVPGRAERRRDRDDRGEGRRAARASDADERVRHGRRDRQGRRGGDGVRHAQAAVHGVDRRHVERRARTTMPTWRGCATPGTPSRSTGPVRST